MANTPTRTRAADLPQKTQTRLVRWMVHTIQNDPRAAKSGPEPGTFGRIVTFHGKSGEAQLKAILHGKDVALYRWKRGLDLELRTALAQHALSQTCGVLTSDPSVIAALDSANRNTPEAAPISILSISLGHRPETAESHRSER